MFYVRVRNLPTTGIFSAPRPWVQSDYGFLHLHLRLRTKPSVTEQQWEHLFPSGKPSSSLTWKGMAWLCGPRKAASTVYKTFLNISGNMWGVDLCWLWGMGGHDSKYHQSSRKSPNSPVEVNSGKMTYSCLSGHMESEGRILGHTHSHTPKSHFTHTLRDFSITHHHPGWRQE